MSNDDPAPRRSDADRSLDGNRPAGGGRRVEPTPAVPTAATRGLAGDDPATVHRRLRTISRYLDDLVRVPGTNYRVGLDPILGLLPVVGDAPTTALSVYVVAEAAALGVPRETLARMLLVLAVDATVGSLPVVGDAFDAVWKANARNVRLLEARTVDPGGRVADRRYLLVAGVVLFAVSLAASALTAVAAWWVLGRVGLV